MKINVISCILLTTILISCTPEPKDPIETHRELIVSVLNEGDIFTYAKVNAYKKGQEEAVQDYQPIFLKAIDFYKNKKQLDSAAHYFKKSILTYPSASAYYEWANLLVDQKEYDRAILAYKMAERFNYEPFSKVLYKISCAYAGKEELELSGKYLEYAVKAGYSNFDEINKDPALEKFRAENKSLFLSHLDRGMRGLSDADKLFWLQFKRQFSKVELPLKINSDLDWILLNESTYISFDFEKFVSEMRNEKFSREVSKGFYYFAELIESDKFSALVYIVKNEYYSDFAPLTFKLVTYTPDGKLIDKMEIAGREFMDSPLKEAVIDKELGVTINQFELTYKKDPEKEGYMDNPVVSKKMIESIRYQIKPNGRIVSIGGADQASLVD
ncbi:MAG: hypothetical protein EP338_05995 [Bacteroidetes bacterium]|nr:MAG: hypothetical protein EP338_05995 [Bacteroidota bacterium]